MIIGKRKFDVVNNVYIAGILNYTPDSFSDGGKYNTIDKALWRIEEMIKEGADIIDIGGESTRPGHTKITDEEEIERVFPLLEKIKNNIDITVSLDTYKSGVAKVCCKYIDIVNDIWGLKYDSKMAPVVAENELTCILMHNRKNSEYSSFWADFKHDIDESIQLAHDAGINSNKIIIDGGVGFAKTKNQDLEVINRTKEIKKIGYPVMIATSRKSCIGYVLDNEISDRLTGTLATTAYAVMNGASFIRVHDIKQNAELIKMIKSIEMEEKWTK